jgi:hypothetical protein
LRNAPDESVLIIQAAFLRQKYSHGYYCHGYIFKNKLFSFIYLTAIKISKYSLNGGGLFRKN